MQPTEEEEKKVDDRTQERLSPFLRKLSMLLSVRIRA